MPICGTNPELTVLLTTKNRKEELRRALQSVLLQTARLELIVIDDGSTDGTAEMVQSEFADARLISSTESLGYIVQRNRGALLASTAILVSIDDDATLPSPRTLAQTLEEFSDSRIGAVAIPYIEPNKANKVLQLAPSGEEIWVTDTFIGTAHALRKDVFIGVGGYREHFVHQGEEQDLCIRMLNRGYLVRLGRADPIIHHESPKRDLSRMDFYGSRNSVLFAWHNVPYPALPLHLLVTTYNCAVLSMKLSRLKTRLAGLIAAYRDIFRISRDPVSYECYVRFRAFRKHKATRVEKKQ